MKGLFQFLVNQLWRAPKPVKVEADVVISAIQDYQWFGVVNGDELQQGDIFESCPVYFPPDGLARDVDKTSFKWGEIDLIVMSQSCDLVKEREKVKQVSLCAIWRRSEFKPGHPLSNTKDLEEVRKGRSPLYHMISSSDIPSFEREIRIVDLQQIYSLPVSFLRARAANEKHLRLLPPYREHLSQSFARAFMRVGLPIDIPSFTKK